MNPVIERLGLVVTVAMLIGMWFDPVRAFPLWLLALILLGCADAIMGEPK